MGEGVGACHAGSLKTQETSSNRTTGGPLGYSGGGRKAGTGGRAKVEEEKLILRTSKCRVRLKRRRGNLAVCIHDHTDNQFATRLKEEDASDSSKYPRGRSP